MSNVFQVVQENLSFAFALSNLERKNKKFQVIWKQKIEAKKIVSLRFLISSILIFFEAISIRGRSVAFNSGKTFTTADPLSDPKLFRWPNFTASDEKLNGFFSSRSK